VLGYEKQVLERLKGWLSKKINPEKKEGEGS
jgi:hypothetical protein